jgi:hypothetical protein
VRFHRNSHVRRISGFSKCHSLSDIEIPQSVRAIGDFRHRNAFRECIALREIRFAPASEINLLYGFSKCKMTLVGIPPRVDMKTSPTQAFLIFTDDFSRMKDYRRHFHVGSCESSVKIRSLYEWCNHFDDDY